jgi:peptide/nickel transport system permease protein
VKTFLLRRLLAIVPLVLAVTFATQALLVLAPGDYLSILAENPAVSDEYIAQLRSQYHLDSKNVFVRYYYWVKNAIVGEFGFSFRFQLPVWQLIADRIVNTMILAVGALVIAWGLAIPLGVLSAVKKDTILDRLAGAFSFAGLSMPGVFYSLLMILFAAKTGWFPIGGIHDQVYWDFMTPWQKVTDTLWHLVLPATVLGTIGTAQYMRQMRGEMIETLSQDYIRTAKAKGLAPRQVLFRHALGNAINPLITLFGFSLAYLLAGALITEVVFTWPGMGRLTYEALLAKDEPLVMASIVMLTVMLVIGSLVADILLAWVDPRIRLE